MNEETRMDIRKLLKSFGIQADEALSQYLAENPDGPPLKVRVTLAPAQAGQPGPAFEIEGEIRR